MAKRHYTVSQKRFQKRGAYKHSQKFLEKQRQIDAYIETRKRLEKKGIRFEAPASTTRRSIQKGINLTGKGGALTALEQLETSPAQARAAYDMAQKILNSAVRDSNGKIVNQQIAAFDKITVIDFLAYTEKAERFWEYVRNNGGEFKELAEY